MQLNKQVFKVPDGQDLVKFSLNQVLRLPVAALEFFWLLGT